MRENEVRAQVSGAKSALNEPGLMSSAVRQTPLTATLSPVFSSVGALLGRNGDAAIFAALFDAGDASYFFHDAGKHEDLETPNIITSDNALHERSSLTNSAHQSS